MEELTLRLCCPPSKLEPRQPNSFAKFVVNSSEHKNPLTEAVKMADRQTTNLRFCLWRMFLGIVDIEAPW